MATSGMLGYGFTEEAFRNGLESEPDFIACDCGSMDPGPYYLGAGEPFVSRAAVKRDLSLMIEAGIERSIPVLLGSAGGAGGDPHIDWTMEIVREIAADTGLHFKAAVIRFAAGSINSGKSDPISIWIGLPTGGPASCLRGSTITPARGAVRCLMSASMSSAGRRAVQSVNSSWMVPIKSSGSSRSIPEEATLAA